MISCCGEPSPGRASHRRLDPQDAAQPVAHTVERGGSPRKIAMRSSAPPNGPCDDAATSRRLALRSADDGEHRRGPAGRDQVCERVDPADLAALFCKIARARRARACSRRSRATSPTTSPFPADDADGGARRRAPPRQSEISIQVTRITNTVRTPLSALRPSPGTAPFVLEEGDDLARERLHLGEEGAHLRRRLVLRRPGHIFSWMT